MEWSNFGLVQLVNLTKLVYIFNATTYMNQAVCPGEIMFPPLPSLCGTIQLVCLQPSHHRVCWSSGMCLRSRTALVCPLDCSVTSSDHSCVMESWLFPGSPQWCIFKSHRNSKLKTECQVQLYPCRGFYFQQPSSSENSDL